MVNVFRTEPASVLTLPVQTVEPTSEPQCVHPNPSAPTGETALECRWRIARTPGGDRIVTAGWTLATSAE